MESVPRSLRIWFIIHFVADMLFAVPMIAAPFWIGGLFGFQFTEPVFPRLVGAALVGIGGVSLYMHNFGRETYIALLTLKILWSLAAILALGISIAEGGPSSLWLFLGIFVAFNGIWTFYRLRM